MLKFTIGLAVTVLLAVVSGCGTNQTLRVTSIQLGRALNADKTVDGFTTTFAPGDSVYLAVLTNGSGSATIGVRWVYATRVIDEPKKQVAYTGAAATDFRLQNVGGFPLGDYTAEVFLNGQSIATRTFRVETPR
jgi:hypothetical protein